MDWHVGQKVAVYHGWNSITKDTVAKVGKLHFTLQKFQTTKFRKTTGYDTSDGYHFSYVKPWSEEVEAEYNHLLAERRVKLLMNALGENRDKMLGRAEAVLPHLEAAVAAMNETEAPQEDVTR